MKRYFMAFIGVILIGFNVTLLNLSGFGVDTFSCMNMAVSEHLPFSYGVWQIIVNIVILIRRRSRHFPAGAAVICRIRFVRSAAKN